MQNEAEFFESPAAFRAWLRKNHKMAGEVLIRFFKTHTGKPSMTWPESVAVALCFGWIDGIRRRLDDDSYTIRFTPRKPRSNWSAINIRMMGELEAAGKMTDAGRAAFARRPGATAARSKGYSYEQKETPPSLDTARLREFKKNQAAWAFFQGQPPGYRKKVSWWVMSAKQDKTRDSRFAKLLDSCAVGKRLG
jgi:uncharacterized protein YdeI (YjbR/CyaY-like superfamily)